MTAILSLSACLDGPGNTGIDVLPDNDLLTTAFTDTQSIIFESVLVDSVSTYRAQRQLVGNYADPEFGRITATTYTELLPRNGLIFAEDPDDLIFDSLVLQIVVDAGYGKIDEAQTLRVHLLEDTFPNAETISSKTEIAYQPDDLANGKPFGFNETVITTFRIRLDDELGKKILFTSPDTLEDRDLMKFILPGFRISTDPVQFFSREPGAVFSLDLEADNSQLLMYYQLRDSATGVFEQTELPEPFRILTITPKFTQIERTELTTDRLLGKFLPDPDENQEYEFVQAGALIKGFIKFPEIDDLKGVAIQRAELLLNVDETWLGSNNRYRPPGSFTVAYAGPDGNELITDEGIALVTTPPTYDEEEGHYSVLLTNYVQQIISGQRANDGMVILPDLANLSVNRVVLGGNTHPTLAPELRITYTQLPR
ncbi:MAG: DUF4270 family protein [Bacteroidota bacterium]